MSKIHEKILDSITKIINENKDLIIRNYNEKADQILLQKELVDQIYHIAEEYTQDAKDTRTLLKYTIKKILNLNESDVIVSRNGNYFIKLFDVSKKKDASVERRFDGIDENDLKSFYDEVCSEDTIEKILGIVAKEFVSVLDSEQFSNERYEQYVFKDIQTMVCNYMTKKYDNTEEFFFGFSGYFFRIHFEKMFEYVADNILYEVANVNEHIIEFIKYYSINILVLDGKKYQLPSIETNDGVNWTTPSILSIAKKHFKAKEYREAIQNDIETLKGDISNLLIDGISPLQHKQNTLKQLDELNVKMMELNQDFDINSDSLALAKTDDEKKLLKEKLSGLKDSMKDVRDHISIVKGRDVSNSVVEKYEKAQRELGAKIKDLKTKEKNASQTTQLYNSMRKSFVKALISKKKLL